MIQSYNCCHLWKKNDEASASVFKLFCMDESLTLITTNIPVDSLMLFLFLFNEEISILDTIN